MLDIIQAGPKFSMKCNIRYLKFLSWSNNVWQVSSTFCIFYEADFRRTFEFNKTAQYSDIFLSSFRQKRQTSQWHWLLTYFTASGVYFSAVCDVSEIPSKVYRTYVHVPGSDVTSGRGLCVQWGTHENPSNRHKTFFILY